MLPEYLLTSLADSFQDGVCITDQDGRILLVNRKHAENSGMTQAEMLGHSVQDFMRSGKLNPVLNPEIISSRRPLTRIQQTAGGRRLVLEGHPVFDEQGNVALCVTFTRDTTSLRQWHHRLQEQKALLETLQKAATGDMGTKLVTDHNSPAMRHLADTVATVAETDATVLILGETGVGKDVTARRIHALSPRRDQPFVKVDCGSIPAGLIESELFGYSPGTFSGGNRQGKTGLIEAAAGGTLFLDEIGDLPLPMQSRLLRFLQDGEIVRIGSAQPRPLDVRILSATNRDLESAVKDGTFRRDLYYRLKVAVLRIPPLRERRPDILPLAHSFLTFYGAKYHRHTALSPEAEQLLLAHSWPGNVRELENTMQSLVIACAGDSIQAEDIPLPLKAARKQAFPALSETEAASYKDLLRNMEKELLAALMEKYKTIANIAAHLNVNRSTLYRKARAFGLL